MNVSLCGLRDSLIKYVPTDVLQTTQESSMTKRTINEVTRRLRKFLEGSAGVSGHLHFWHDSNFHKAHRGNGHSTAKRRRKTAAVFI